MTLTAPLSLRVDGEKREIIGRLLAWGETVKADGRLERFAQGAFQGTDPADVRLYVEHPNLPGRSVGPGAVGRAVPIGVATELDDRDDGLYATFAVARTAAGDEALELVRSGVLKDLSIGFAPIAAGTRALKGGAVEYTRALLDHVAITATGSYPSARVLATRTNPDPDPDPVPDPPPTVEEPVTAPDPVPVPDESPDDDDNGAPVRGTLPPETIMHRMDTLEDTLRGFAASQAPAPSPRPAVDPIQWFRGEVLALHHRDASHRVNLRALADITGELGGPATDMSAFVVEELLSSQLVNELDTRRPLFAALGRFPMPASGYARVPTITTHTKVGPRTGQKDPANTRAMASTTLPYEATWFDGAVDIALEWLATADGPGLALVWDDLLGQYAIATEDDAIAKVAAAATPTGAVLPTTDYEAFAAAVATQSIQVRKATGAPASYLAVPEAMWPTIITFTDAGGRRIFSTSGGSNADASVTLTAEAFALPGGIAVFWADVTNPILSNQRAVIAADGGPSRVEAINVELMGRDLGLLGRTMVIPRIPAGIREFSVTTARAAKTDKE